MKKMTRNLLTLALLAAGASTGKAQSVTSSDTLKTDTLKSVTVTAAKPYITQKAGKIILQVAESPVAAGGNAYDVIKRAPGVMELQGDLQFRGKKVTVLMDGRLINLDGAELNNLLTNTPANTIASVEIIPNPSAKYDAKGGVVINIITTKSKKFGTNGTITAGTGGGIYGRYNGGLSLNHRSGKLNAYGSYDYTHSQKYSDVSSLRLLNDASITENNHTIAAYNNHFLKAGLDYDINKNQSIGILFKGGIAETNKTLDNRSKLSDLRAGADSLSAMQSTGYSRITNPSVNMYYKIRLDSTGKELTVNADYFSYNKKWNDDFVTRYFDTKGNEYTSAYFLRDQSPAANSVKAISADYVQPLKFGKLEAGVKATFTTTDNDVLWEQQQDGQWVSDPGKTNHFIYKENVNAAYATLSGTFKKFDWEAGLRAEQTNTEGYSVTMDQVNRRNYTQLFPNVSLGWNQSADNQFSFAYRKSIQRFQFDVVNPFIIYRSQYSYYQGNPAIRPSIQHNFSVSHTYKNALSTSLSYMYFTDALGTTYRNGTTPGSVITSSENLGTLDVWSADISYSKSFLNNKWVATNNVSVFYGKYNTPEAELNQGMVSTMITSHNMFLLPKGFKTEVFARYTSPMLFSGMKIRGNYSIDLGVSKSVFSKRGTIALNVSDVFNTDVARWEVNAFKVNTITRAKSESRILKLQFTWKFGNHNVKAASNRKTGLENETRRMN